MKEWKLHGNKNHPIFVGSCNCRGVLSDLKSIAETFYMILNQLPRCFLSESKGLLSSAGPRTPSKTYSWRYYQVLCCFMIQMNFFHGVKKCFSSWQQKKFNWFFSSRFAPPLVISESELMECVSIIKETVLNMLN